MLFLVFISLFVGCTSYQGGPSILDGESVTPYVTEGKSLENTPLEMWSPLQRQATAGYYFLVAEYSSMRGDRSQARKLYSAAHRLDSNAYTGSKLLAAESASGQLSSALQRARKMALLYPNSPSIHLTYGRLLGQHRLIEEGIVETEKALLLDPKFESAYLQKSAFFQLLGEKNKALNTIKNLLKVRPSSMKGLNFLIHLYIRDANYGKALSLAKKMYEDMGRSPELGVIYGYLLNLNKQYKKAISIFREINQKSSTNESLIRRVAILTQAFGDLKKISAEFEKLARIGSYSIDLIRVFILWEMKEFSKSFTLVEDLLKVDKESSQLLFLSGLGAERLGNAKKAISFYEKIAKYSKFFVQGQFRISRIFLEEKKLDAALEVVLKLLHFKFTPHEAYEQAANILVAQKKFKNAINILSSGFDRFPNKIKLLFLKGVYEEQSGLIDECIETMKLVINKDPTHSSAMNYLGSIYAEQEEYLDEAEELVEMALELKPQDGFYLDSLAWVYYKQNKYEKAYKTILQALERLPEEGVLLEHLGDILIELDRQSEAVIAFEKALEYLQTQSDKTRVEEKKRDVESN